MRRGSVKQELLENDPQYIENFCQKKEFAESIDQTVEAATAEKSQTIKGQRKVVDQADFAREAKRISELDPSVAGFTEKQTKFAADPCQQQHAAKVEQLKQSRKEEEEQQQLRQDAKQAAGLRQRKVAGGRTDGSSSLYSSSSAASPSSTASSFAPEAAYTEPVSSVEERNTTRANGTIQTPSECAEEQEQEQEQEQRVEECIEDSEDEKQKTYLMGVAAVVLVLLLLKFLL